MKSDLSESRRASQSGHGTLTPTGFKTLFSDRLRASSRRGPFRLGVS
jgi:hypothetical protein